MAGVLAQCRHEPGRHRDHGPDAHAAGRVLDHPDWPRSRPGVRGAEGGGFRGREPQRLAGPDRCAGGPGQGTAGGLVGGVRGSGHGAEALPRAAGSPGPPGPDPLPRPQPAARQHRSQAEEPARIRHGGRRASRGYHCGLRRQGDTEARGTGAHGHEHPAHGRPGPARAGGPDRPVHHREHDPAGRRGAGRGDRDHAARRRFRCVHPLAVHLRGRDGGSPGGRRDADAALARRAAAGRLHVRLLPGPAAKFGSLATQLVVLVAGAGLGLGIFGSWISVRSYLIR